MKFPKFMTEKQAEGISKLLVAANRSFQAGEKAFTQGFAIPPEDTPQYFGWKSQEAAQKVRSENLELMYDCLAASERVDDIMSEAEDIVA